MTHAIQEDLRIVVFQEEDGWVAQCIEYDISVQGSDLKQLHRRLNVALEAESRYTTENFGKEFAGLEPAPEEFVTMYEAASERLDAKLDIRIAA